MRFGHIHFDPDFSVGVVFFYVLAEISMVSTSGYILNHLYLIKTLKNYLTFMAIIWSKCFVYKFSKLADRSSSEPEGSLFNSYFTEI